jgi:hypothetical protein
MIFHRKARAGKDLGTLSGGVRLHCELHATVEY